MYYIIDVLEQVYECFIIPTMKGSKLKLTTKNEQTFPHSNQHVK